MHREAARADGGEEKVIAFPERLPAYRVSRAKHLAGYVRELLDRAQLDTAPEQTAWVKLERPEDEVYA